ncbi:MAG: hypothetical protein AAF563_11725 [Pseudomonadota bacterium]
MNRLTQKYSSKLVAGVAGASFALLSATALATGPSGQTDSALVEIGINNLYNIEGMNDILFGVWNGLGDESRQDDVCVWTNVPSGSYNVTVTSSTGGYTLDSGANQLPVSISWAGAPGQTTGTVLTYATPSSFTTTATAPDCPGADTATFIVDILATDLAAQPASATAYSATMTATITTGP